MSNKENHSTKIRLLNSVCAIALLGSVIYIMVAGFEAMAMGMLALSLAGIAGPVVVSVEGILEVVTGIFEAIVEGVVAIFEAIASALSGLFG